MPDVFEFGVSDLSLVYMGLRAYLSFDELVKRFMQQHGYRWWESWYDRYDGTRWFRFHRTEYPHSKLTPEEYSTILDKLFKK